MSVEITRRNLLAMATAGAGVLALAACGGTTAPATSPSLAAASSKPASPSIAASPASSVATSPAASTAPAAKPSAAGSAGGARWGMTAEQDAAWKGIEDAAKKEGTITFYGSATILTRQGIQKFMEAWKKDYPDIKVDFLSEG